MTGCFRFPPQSFTSDTLLLAVRIHATTPPPNGDGLLPGLQEGKRASHDCPGVDAFSEFFVLVFQLPLTAFVRISHFLYPFRFLPFT